jgi:monovalent cation:H+ antiporter-2, CPA2 family
MTGGLSLVVLLLAAAVLVVVVCRFLHFPALIGYLLVGILVGPSGLALVASTRESNYLAEFGVVFLMFTIGLEFSLPRLLQMRRIVVGLGGLQVGGTIALVTALVVVAGYDWKAGFALGGILAMSSTAIVIRLLAERRELDSPHGKEAFGVLLFQDLAVVPLLILVPALSGAEGELLSQIGWASAKAAIVLTLILFVGQRLMRGWFHIVAARRSNELFILNVLLVTLGLAWITEFAGLSLALGAFLAGMLISETEYRHQVEENIKPFRDVLLGLFFLSVGVQLDGKILVDQAAYVGVFLMLIVAIKFAVVAGLSLLFGSSRGTATRTALALAQGGEFGLVLAAQAADVAIVPPALLQPVLASLLLSMMAGPLWIHYSDWLVLRFVRSEWMAQSLALHKLAVRSFETDHHVVLCGYGRTGQSVARFLNQSGIKYIALDLDPGRVQEADAAGEPVVYGDAAHRELLIAAGLNRASAVMITHTDTASALAVLSHVRAIRPDVPVIVRTVDDSRLDELTAAGATEVVPDTFESSLMLASHALTLIGVPVRSVLHQIRMVRDNRYTLLRGFYHGQSDASELIEAAHQPRLHSVSLGETAFGIGRTVADVAVHRYGVTIRTIRRNQKRIETIDDAFEFAAGDVVVLMGDAAGVSAAELRLMQGAG